MILLTAGGGMGTQSSEESPDSSEDDLYQGGVGMNSGERQCEQNRVMQLSQTVRSPITTLLGHSGVVISCGKSLLRILRYLAKFYPNIAYLISYSITNISIIPI